MVARTAEGPPIKTIFLIGLILGAFAMLIIWGLTIFKNGAHLPVEVRYTVQELTDAIATREATYVEKAIEYEATK